MTFEEICKLYSDETPLSCELKNKLDRQESWAVYMLRDYLITYPSGAIMLHIHKYCYTTEKRVQQMAKSSKHTAKQAATAAASFRTNTANCH